MTRLQKIAVRAATAAALGLAVLGAPAVSDAATASPVPVVSQADLCENIKTVARPILALVGAGLMPLNTALNLIASLTGATVPQILDCLG
ncbi:hypothetical protein [Streptosporangium sp. NPDC048865]|uniref:hypothetical protein n=1 Tax=Streptosporangium sp. NPDC048865 TaxID=3155766 RepID=UPI0034136A9B